MQPIPTNFNGDVASLVGGEQIGDAEPVEFAPTLQDMLKHLMECPQAHTIGDLADLTDRLTNEMMLFSALMGGAVTKAARAAGDENATSTTCADAGQTELHAEFIRELDG
jgi:hypothetical protein